MTVNIAPGSHLPATQTIMIWPILLLILFSFCLTNSNTLPQTTDSDLCYTEDELKGTTYHLKDIFIGKCWLFQTKIAPGRVCYKNCTELWELFSSAFAYKEACDVTREDFMPYLNAAIEDTPVNKTMLWSGVYHLSSQFANLRRRSITIANTLMGFVVDDCRWCGQVEEPGINYESCPSFNGCGSDSQYSSSFWAPASAEFARRASGVVNVLLTSTNVGKPAVNKESLLFTEELVNLNPETVTLVRVLLTHTPGKLIPETCNNGSVKDIEDVCRERNLNFECVDSPSDFRHLLCVDFPDSEECRFAYSNDTLPPGSPSVDSDDIIRASVGPEGFVLCGGCAGVTSLHVKLIISLSVLATLYF